MDSLLHLFWNQCRDQGKMETKPTVALRAVAAGALAAFAKMAAAIKATGGAKLGAAAAAMTAATTAAVAGSKKES